MDYKSTVRKHGIIIAICVICSLLVIAGTSYALFFQTNINSKNQVVKAGKLAVTYGEDSTKITRNELLPVTDQTGLTDDAYKSSVKIENTGSLPASYVLTLAKDLEAIETAGKNANNFIDLQYVKIAVFVGDSRVPLKNEGANQGVKLSDLTAKEDGSYEIHTGSLPAEGNETINVRLWLDSNTPETETDKLVFFKLDVKSVVDEPNTEEYQAGNNS